MCQEGRALLNPGRRGWLPVSAPAKAVELAPVALCGPACTAVTSEVRQSELFGRRPRSAVDVARGGDWGADASFEDGSDLDDVLAAGVAHHYRVAWLHESRRLCAGLVELDVESSARLGCFRPRSAGRSANVSSKYAERCSSPARIGGR
jgi:hypothetical protein